MSRVLSLIDRLNQALGLLAAWLFFLTGAMISYEVIARYFFHAPTIWAAELSQLALLWGTFIAMATLLRRRQHIQISILTDKLGRRGTNIAEGLSFLLIGLFCLVPIVYGWRIAFESFERGRSTGTMLNIPNWWSEVVIPIGFALLLLQCIAELLRLVLGGGQRSAEQREP